MADGRSQIIVRSDDPPVAQAPLVSANEYGGAVKTIISTFTNPSAGGVAVGESIRWARLPQGARLLPSTRLFWANGAASSTLTLGDRASIARYLAATAVTSAGSATADAAYATGAIPSVATNTQFFNAVGQGVNAIPATDENELISRCAGANLAAGQRITLVAQYVERSA